MPDIVPVQHRIGGIPQPYDGYGQIIKIFQLAFQRLPEDFGAAPLQVRRSLIQAPTRVSDARAVIWAMRAPYDSGRLQTNLSTQLTSQYIKSITPSTHGLGLRPCTNWQPPIRASRSARRCLSFRSTPMRRARHLSLAPAPFGSTMLETKLQYAAKTVARLDASDATTEIDAILSSPPRRHGDKCPVTALTRLVVSRLLGQDSNLQPCG